PDPDRGPREQREQHVRFEEREACGVVAEGEPRRDGPYRRKDEGLRGARGPTRRLRPRPTEDEGGHEQYAEGIARPPGEEGGGEGRAGPDVRRAGPEQRRNYRPERRYERQAQNPGDLVNRRRIL